MSDGFVIIPRAHDLKIAPKHFRDVLDGSKRQETRTDDRGFSVGDVVILREWMDDGHASQYSGRFVVARVTHILRESAGLVDGYVVLSIDVVATDGRPVE